MFDCKSIVTDDILKMTFVPDAVDKTKLAAFYTDGSGPAGTVVVGLDNELYSSDEVEEQYKLWLVRPERWVGKKVFVEGQNLEALAEMYDSLLVGATILSQKLNVTADRKQPYEVTLDWLRTTDFYTAPASSQYHESFVGGLLVHSLNVYNQVVELHELSAFKSIDIAQATIAALVHDWCKIGYYEHYKRNVKNDQGKWEEVDAYRTNQKGLPFGHGVTSLYIAMRLFRLTEEQALAIRHHMGVWNCADVEKGELQRANQTYPMVYLIQFADQLACTEYSNKEVQQ